MKFELPEELISDTAVMLFGLEEEANPSTNQKVVAESHLWFAYRFYTGDDEAFISFAESMVDF